MLSLLVPSLPLDR